MRSLAFVGLALALALAAGSAALGDTVKLKDGKIIKGRVTDRGAYVIVEHDYAPSPATVNAQPQPRNASTRIDRRDIESIEVDGAAPKQASDLDVVVFVNGDELPGRVEIRDGGKDVVIVSGDKRGQGELHFESRLVRTILWSQRSQSEQRSGDAPIGTAIKTLLADATSKDPEAARDARARLYALGVYALPYLESRAEDPDPAVRAAIARVLEVARLKSYMTPGLAERVPGLARQIVETTGAERIAAVKDAVVGSPQDCAPILVHLAKTDHDPAVRAFVLGQLQLMGRTRELMDLLDSKEGALRFAAAVALGDNGVYVGIPLLIEGLKHPEAQVRKVAIAKLDAWTGQFFGYFADDPEAERAKHVAEWEEWWKKEGPALVERSLRATTEPGRVSDDDKAFGVAHWTTAQDMWGRINQLGLEGDARRAEVEKVKRELEKSLDRYPQNVNARISLGVLEYMELGDAASARKELDLVLRRYDDESSPRARFMAHYHLARAEEADRKWAEAEQDLHLALTIEPKSADALKALGLLLYDRAIGDETLAAEAVARAKTDADRLVAQVEARRALLEEAVKRLGEAREAIDRYDAEIHDDADKAAEGIALADAYGAPKFRATVEDAKAELRRTAADVRFLRGRALLALHDFPPAGCGPSMDENDLAALEEFSSALELTPRDTPEARFYLYAVKQLKEMIDPRAPRAEPPPPPAAPAPEPAKPPGSGLSDPGGPLEPPK
jgi:tetratricopeptide (TPR) repeat protein